MRINPNDSKEENSMAEVSQIRVKGTLYDIKDAVARLSTGAPAVAATVAAMDNTSKIYVYIGSESGYINGNWYYYDGSSWVSGGVYQSAAVETDTSLSVNGAPADAKAAGDAIDNIVHVGAEATSGYTQMLVSPTSQELNLLTQADFDSAMSDLKADIINYPTDSSGEKILPVAEKMLTVKPDGSTDYDDIPVGNVVKNLLFDSFTEDDSKTKVNITVNTSGTPVTGEIKGLRSTGQILTGDGTVGIPGLTNEGNLWYTANGKSLIFPVISGHTYAFVAKTRKDEDGWYGYEGIIFAPDFDFTFTRPYENIPKTSGSVAPSESDFSDGSGKIFRGARITVPANMQYMIMKGNWKIVENNEFREFELYDYTEYPVNPEDTPYDKIVEEPVVGNTYKISYALTNATSSNTATIAGGSSQYKTTITADSGKIIGSCSVKVGNFVYDAVDGEITVDGAASNIKVIAEAVAVSEGTYVGAYSVKRELIPEDLLAEKMDVPNGLSRAEEGQTLYADGSGGLTIDDAPFVPNCKISMDWQDVYGFWTAGYFYDPTNNYAYTQIPAGDKLWTETELRLGVSCTPYDNLISVNQGERYRYRNTKIHHDRLNMYLPGVYIFDSNKNVIQTIEGGGEYNEFVIPKGGTYMAVLFYNAQANYSLQRYDVVGVGKKDMLAAVQANYRSFMRGTNPTMQALDKVYFCIGSDDLRPWQTKRIHDYFTSHNIPYYMASIPEAVKASVHEDPYKVNLDYMRLCVANGGEIVCHSDEWITADNIDDLDMLYRYFYLHKKELEFYGFDVKGIFLAGGSGAINVDERINSWATYLYEYSDAFGYAFPYNFLNRGDKIIEYMSPSQIDSVINNAFSNHSFACLLLHELNETATTALDHMLQTLSTYTRGVDYDFITPYELYKKLMPEPQAG